MSTINPFYEVDGIYILSVEGVGFSQYCKILNALKIKWIVKTDMVAKIATEIEHNHTHKSIAAITFTIKAAQEIKDRLTIDSSRHFIGTNNSFVIEEIIKPFLKDVYGAEFEVDMSTDYSIRIDTFEAGLDKVKREQVLCSYTDSKKNFVFDLALDVIMKSSACRLYLQAKYFKIYIDEYCEMLRLLCK